MIVREKWVLGTNLNELSRLETDISVSFKYLSLVRKLTGLYRSFISRPFKSGKKLILKEFSIKPNISEIFKGRQNASTH